MHAHVCSRICRLSYLRRREPGNCTRGWHAACFCGTLRSFFHPTVNRLNDKARVESQFHKTHITFPERTLFFLPINFNTCVNHEIETFGRRHKNWRVFGRLSMGSYFCSSFSPAKCLNGRARRSSQGWMQRSATQERMQNVSAMQKKSAFTRWEFSLA